jgi:hypothetical protein
MTINIIAGQVASLAWISFLILAPEDYGVFIFICGFHKNAN